MTDSVNAYSPMQPRTLLQVPCSPLLACLQLWGAHSLMKNPFLSSDDSVFVQKPGLMVMEATSQGRFLRAYLCPVNHMGQTCSWSPWHPLAETSTALGSAPRADLAPAPRLAHWRLCCSHVTHPRFPNATLHGLFPMPPALGWLLVIRSLYKRGLFS